MTTRALLTATALFTFANAHAAEPLLAVCRVTGNTKGPPRVVVADDKEGAAKVPSSPPESRRTALASTFDAKVVAALPSCDPKPEERS